MLLEEIGEMRYFIKPQCIGDFGYIPLGLFEQYPGFFDDPAIDDISRASAGGFFQDFVQMINMDSQCFSKFQWCFELDNLLHMFNRKLSFQ